MSAIKRASTRWGGIQEPILPVSPTGRVQPAWCQIAETLSPDVVFDSAELSDKARERVTQQIGAPVTHVNNEDLPQYGLHPACVAIPRSAIWATSMNYPGCVAGTGPIPADTGGWAEEGISVHTIKDDVDQAIRQMRGQSLIEVTSTQVGEVSLSTLMNGVAIVWVSKRGSIKDALWFWNIRALMPRSFGTHIAALITPEAARMSDVGDALRTELSAHRKWSTPDVIIISFTEPDEELARIGQGWGLKQTDEIKGHLAGSARARDEDITFRVNVDPRRWLLGRRTSGLRRTETTVVSKPYTEVAVRSPVDFRRATGTVRARVSGLPFLTVPARPEVAGTIDENAFWVNGLLERDVRSMPTHRLRLNVPDPSMVFVKCLESVGLTYELSQPGKLASALSSLTPTSVLDSESVRAVVRTLTTSRSRELAREISELANGVGPEEAAVLADRLQTQIRRKELDTQALASGAGLPQAEAASAAEQLTQVGLAERGLQVGCSTCGLTSFIPFERVLSQPECPACQMRGEFSRRQSGELAIHYRLNALLDRASDQGVIPHLITANRLAMDPHTSYLTLGAHLFEEGGAAIGEVDLLGYRGGEFICGEVKTSAGGFTPGEIVRATKLANRVQADILVFGCTDSISSDLLAELFAAASTHRLRVEVVDDVDLHRNPQPEPNIGTLGEP